MLHISSSQFLRSSGFHNQRLFIILTYVVHRTSCLCELLFIRILPQEISKLVSLNRLTSLSITFTVLFYNLIMRKGFYIILMKSSCYFCNVKFVTSILISNFFRNRVEKTIIIFINKLKNSYFLTKSFI